MYTLDIYPNLLVILFYITSHINPYHILVIIVGHKKY